MAHWILKTARCKLCGKVSYQTEDDAEYAGGRMPQPMLPYKCFYGNGWHLTSQNKHPKAVPPGTEERD